MTATLETPEIRSALLAIWLDQLAELIGRQGEQLLEQGGVGIPARTVSIVLAISEGDGVTAADLAARLEQSHQLITQKVELLLLAGLAERYPDPKDGRRKLLKLTTLGSRQLKTLQAHLRSVSKAFDEVFTEIDCDLAGKVRDAIAVLKQRPLTERAKAASA